MKEETIVEKALEMLQKETSIEAKCAR
jgi:hypothetical protein